MAAFFLAYGVLLPLLGWLARAADPSIAQVAFLTGAVGGPLCLGWGLSGWAGLRRRIWPGLTLALINLVLVTQMVTGWLRPDEPQPGSLSAAILMTLMFLISLALLIGLTHFGAATPVGSSAEEPRSRAPQRRDRVSSATPH